MKSFILFGLFAEALGLSLRMGETTTNPCTVSPCGQNALCEMSAQGLAFCHCKPGYSGNPFEHCVSLSPEATTIQMTSSSSTGTGSVPSMSTMGHVHTHSPTAIHSQVQDSGLSLSQNPVRFTVEYQTSTDSQKKDLSRVPILGSSGTNDNNERVSIPIDSHQIHDHQETVVQTEFRPIVQSQPPLNNYHTTVNQYIPSKTSLDAVADPMGKYSNCRQINNVIVCADTSNSVDDERPQGHPHQIPSHHNIPDMQNRYDPSSHLSEVTNRPSIIPQNPNGDCKSMCGINSVCRMLGTRAICGCPEGTSGDPGVRCDFLALHEESSGCQKHTDCSPSEICNESKCVDPCVSSKMTCGNNAKCVIVQRTPLCACLDGFLGNPYAGCATKK